MFYNKEYFLWGIYCYKFDNGFLFMFYMCLVLVKGLQSFCDLNNYEIVYKEKNCSCYGLQVFYLLMKQILIFVDIYYCLE